MIRELGHIVTRTVRSISPRGRDLNALEDIQGYARRERADAQVKRSQGNYRDASHHELNAEFWDAAIRRRNKHARPQE